MISRLGMLVALLLLLPGVVRGEPQQELLLVVGAEGDPQYGEMFQQWAERWQQAAERAGVRVLTIGTVAEDSPTPTDLERLQQAIGQFAADSPEPLWIVLIGHGTFDGQSARFNLRGPDLSTQELAKWLEPLERSIAVINCTASSAPFLNELSKPGRVIVTATRSGSEQNFARFGDFMSQAISSESVDLDKDQQTSLLEAFLWATRKTSEYYEQDGRLATEHALLDDNGDQRGTPGDWFHGIRAEPEKAAEGQMLDGLQANQLHLVRSAEERALPVEVRQRRDELEKELEALRSRKASLPEEEYYRELERRLVEIARLYEQAGEVGEGGS